MARKPETLEDRWLLEAQTARNLEGLSAEQAGDLETAIALYERNVEEGFPGDLPYGRRPGLIPHVAALTSWMCTFGSSTMWKRSLALPPVVNPREPQW